MIGVVLPLAGLLAFGLGHRSTSPRVSALLRLAAAVACVVPAVGLFAPTARDSTTTFALVTLGGAALVGVLPVLLAYPLVTLGAAVLLVAFSLVFGLGFGLAFAPAALLMSAAAGGNVRNGRSPP